MPGAARSVIKDRPLWSLGIAAHWARHASGHNIGSNNHSGLEKKNHLFSMTSVSGPRGFERPTGRHPPKVPLKRLTEFGFVPTFRVRVGTIYSRLVSVARSRTPPGVSRDRWPRKMYIPAPRCVPAMRRLLPVETGERHHISPIVGPFADRRVSKSPFAKPAICRSAAAACISSNTRTTIAKSLSLSPSTIRHDQAALIISRA
jgi:hypothetical protein